MIYLIGSLRNPKIPEIGNKLREAGFEIFDDWFAAGPEADDCWKHYEMARGHNNKDAIAGYAACHVYEYDKFHLDRSNAAVLVLPAGRSGFLELGYIIGCGKPGFILMQEDPERYDVMFKFATIVMTIEELVEKLNESLPGSKV